MEWLRMLPGSTTEEGTTSNRYLSSSFFDTSP